MKNFFRGSLGQTLTEFISQWKKLLVDNVVPANVTFWLWLLVEASIRFQWNREWWLTKKFCKVPLIPPTRPPRKIDGFYKFAEQVG